MTHRFGTGSGTALGLVLLTLGGCGSAPSEIPVSDGTSAPDGCRSSLVYTLAPDPGTTGEAYLCYGFDAAALGDRVMSGLIWRPPVGGGVTWHHATLSAVAGDFPDGPAACDGMPPGSVSLHVWAPGGDDLVLPAATGLELPKGTTRLAVEMHVLRTGAAPIQPGSIRLCLDDPHLDHVAGFQGMSVPVPALRPRTREAASWRCRFIAATHLWSVWPHMHLLGNTIEAILLRKSGERSTLTRIDPWDFYRQRTYRLDIDVEEGDEIESSCSWTNVTDDYVFAGPRTTDEMCNQGFIGWPAPLLSCAESR